MSTCVWNFHYTYKGLPKDRDCECLEANLENASQGDTTHLSGTGKITHYRVLNIEKRGRRIFLKTPIMITTYKKGEKNMKSSPVSVITLIG